MCQGLPLLSGTNIGGMTTDVAVFDSGCGFTVVA